MHPTDHRDSKTERARGPLGRAVGVLLALLLATAACDRGGEDATVTISEDASPQELMAELQQIQQELGAIQQQALARPEIQGQRDSLETRLRDEMREVDPEAPEKMDRAEAIGNEFEAAQAAGEEEQARELALEHQEIQSSLETTQRQVLETEEMSTALASFQENMVQAMNDVDPRTDSLMARADAIVAHLQEEMARQQAAPPGAQPAPDGAPVPEGDAVPEDGAAPEDGRTEPEGA